MLQILVDTCTITNDCVSEDPNIHIGLFHRSKKVISQLRLGYTLNEYRYKIGLQMFHCAAVMI